jgi:hypothetical protein
MVKSDIVEGIGAVCLVVGFTLWLGVAAAFITAGLAFLVKAAAMGVRVP